MIRGGVLALDPSRDTGWAYGAPGQAVPEAGHWLLPDLGGWVARAAGLEHELGDFLARWQPCQVVVEDPLPPAAQTHTLSALGQYSLHTMVKVSAYWVNIPVFGVSASTVRYELLGRAHMGDETKRMVLDYCRRHGIKTGNHNVADAAMLWWWYILDRRRSHATA